MRTGPFIPDQQARVLYSMCADDCSLHFDLAKLTPKQQADHKANLDLIAMPQLASSYIGKPTDHVAVYDAFDDPAWRETLEFYNAAHQRMGLEPIPLENFHFYPRETFYETLAADLSAGNIDVDLNTLYMISGWNSVLHGSEAALEVSRSANSKMQLAADAERFGIPVPETRVFRKSDLGGKEVADLFVAHGNTLMLKIKGLVGARNVTTVNSPADALDYLAEFPDDLEVVLQRKLDADSYTEMTVDLCVSDTDISIANVRRILFAEGLWVGNLIGPEATLTAAQQEILVHVGRYARELGHTSPEGYNCGIDFFVGPEGDDELLVIEINARWTGGLFPAQMVTRLGVQRETTVVFFDRVTRERLADYLTFQDRYLFGGFDGPYASVPLGFSPFPAEIDGEAYVYVWQMVVGDFEAFKRAKRDSLGDGQLPTADLISLSAT
jgi:hypothetical protein